MRRTCVLIFISALLTLLFSRAASSQAFSKAEIFAGSSYLHTGGGLQASATQACQLLLVVPCPLHVHSGANGWEGSGQLNLYSWLGLTADIAGHYNTPLTADFSSLGLGGGSGFNFAGPSQRTYDFLFGPVLSYRRPRHAPFLHTLLGAEHVGFGTMALPLGLGTLPARPSHTHFAFALGGGLDVKVSKHFAIRVGQLDYQFVNTSAGGHQNDFRFSGGVVFGFGGEN